MISHDFPADRGLYLCRKAKEKRPLSLCSYSVPLSRSDMFSVTHVQKLP